jgi:hypothetical protein
MRWRSTLAACIAICGCTSDPPLDIDSVHDANSGADTLSDINAEPVADTHAEEGASGDTDGGHDDADVFVEPDTITIDSDADTTTDSGSSVCDRALGSSCPVGCGRAPLTRIDIASGCRRPFEDLCYGTPAPGDASTPCSSVVDCIVSPTGVLFETGCYLASPPSGYRKCTDAERASAMAVSGVCTTPSPCCELGAPSCSCPVTHTASDGSCIRICDAAPVGWTKKLDDRGCPAWSVPLGSCLSPPPPG